VKTSYFILFISQLLWISSGLLLAESDFVTKKSTNRMLSDSNDHAAFSDEAENLYRLAEGYLKGSGGKRSYPLSIQYYEKSADLGHVKAKEKLIWLNSYLPNELSLKRRYRRELQEAKKDNPSAQFLLAEMCEFGLGVNKDIERAIFWYKKSAEKNYGKAQNRLGELYSLGKITENNTEDHHQAFLWIQAAANNEQPQAQYKLATYYEMGTENLEINKKSAFIWYLKSAENGHIQGQMKTGQMLKEGECLKQNYGQALYWY